MDSETPAAPEIESERAYVVYDPDTGHIVHVHQAMTFRGAKGRSAEQDQARALELARRLGHRGEGLRVLRVEPADLDEDQPQRVDVDRLQLVPDRAADAP